MPNFLRLMNPSVKCKLWSLHDQEKHFYSLFLQQPGNKKKVLFHVHTYCTYWNPYNVTVQCFLKRNPPFFEGGHINTIAMCKVSVFMMYSHYCALFSTLFISFHLVGFFLALPPIYSVCDRINFILCNDIKIFDCTFFFFSFFLIAFAFTCNYVA